jgi:hypothetical protein
VKAREYYAVIQAAILAAPHVIQSNVAFDEVTENESYIRGTLTIAGNYELHLAEYVVTEPQITRLKYRHHVQAADNRLLARWDNAPHHPEIATYPDHLHIGNTVRANPPMDIPQVLTAILDFIR